MAKRTSLQAALDNVTGKPETTETLRQPPESLPQSNTNLAPSRRGKKAIVGYFDPAVSRQLKQLALERDTTIQALLSEGLNDLFTKYGKSPLA